MAGNGSSRGSRAAAARRHRELLARQRQSAQARTELIEALRARRAGMQDIPQFVPSSVDLPGGLGVMEVLRVPSELLVRTGDLTPQAREDVQQAGFSVKEEEGLERRVTTLRSPDPMGEDVDTLRATLKGHGVTSSVAYLTPNRVVMKTLATPVKVTDRPLPGNLAPSVADAGPVVVVLDTGVYQGERTDGWLAGLQNDTNQDELDVFPCPNGKLDFAAGHGTFIAGVIRQIDPRLRLEVERVSDSDGFAHEVTVASAMVSAVRSRLDRGGKVVLNLSLGTETMDGQPPVALTVGMEIVREIAEARGGEVLVVAAAGNAGAEVRCWPAAFGQDHDDVVAVAALDEEGEPVEWSSHGPWVKASAIGEAVLSTFVEGQEDPAIDPDGDSFPADAWAYWSGTSFAAPKVAAAIAQHSLETGCSLAEATKQVLARGRKYRGYGSALTYFEKGKAASQPK